MGSSASKAARKLPTTTPSKVRPPPSLAGARTPQSDQMIGSDGMTGSRASPSASPAEGSQIIDGRDPSGQDAGGRPIGKSPGEFSGEKDETVRRDGLDPGFASNLSRLGPVSIQDAGKFMRTPAPAQRTLNARRDEYDNASASSMPAGHLSIASLGSLLDQAKTLPAGASRRQVYEDYGLDEQTMEEMRKWVNSVSVGAGVEVRLVDGEEVREMLAIWVDSPESSPPPQKLLPTG